MKGKVASCWTPCLSKSQFKSGPYLLRRLVSRHQSLRAFSARGKACTMHNRSPILLCYCNLPSYYGISNSQGGHRYRQGGHIARTSRATHQEALTASERSRGICGRPHPCQRASQAPPRSIVLHCHWVERRSGSTPKQESRARAPSCAWATPRPGKEDARHSLSVHTNMMLLQHVG